MSCIISCVLISGIKLKVSQNVLCPGVPLLDALPGSDDLPTRAKAEGGQPAALQLCGGTGGNQG